MPLIAAIALGGACGAVLRYFVAIGSYRLLGQGFPYGTLIVNCVGSFLIGWLTVWFLERSIISPEWRSFMLIGVLGAFTTFSTFSLETLNLVENQQLLAALLNIGLNLFSCLFAVWLGLTLGRMS